MRLWLMVALLGVGGCGAPAAPPPVARPSAPTDAAHPNVVGPHGDHTPRQGGLVLMNGDLHYEVVLAPDGRHAVWFTDAIRNELPASVAREVTLRIIRPGAADETLKLQIDDAGESWIGRGTPIEGDDVLVHVRYLLPGEPAYEIEIPFVRPPASP